MQNEEQEPLAAADVPPIQAIRTHLGDLTNEIAHKYSLLEGTHLIIAQAIQKLDLRGGFTTTWQAKSLEQALNLSQVTDLVKEVIKQQKSSYSSRSVAQSRTICALLAHICESVWMRCGIEVQNVVSGNQTSHFKLESFAQDLDDGFLGQDPNSDDFVSDILKNIKECVSALGARDTAKLKLSIQQLSRLRVANGFAPWQPFPHDLTNTPNVSPAEQADMTFGSTMRDTQPQDTVEPRMPKVDRPEVIQVSGQPEQEVEVLAPQVADPPEQAVTHPRSIRDRVRSFGLPNTFDGLEINKRQSVGPLAEESIEDANSQDGGEAASAGVYPHNALDQAQVFQADSGLELMQEQLSRSSGWNGMILDRLEPQPELLKTNQDPDSGLSSPHQKEGMYFRQMEVQSQQEVLDQLQSQQNIFTNDSQRSISQTESVPGEGIVRKIPVQGQLQNPLAANVRRSTLSSLIPTRETKDSYWEKVEQVLFASVEIKLELHIREILHFAILTKYHTIQTEAQELISSESTRLTQLMPAPVIVQIFRHGLQTIRAVAQYSTSTTWNHPLWFLLKWVMVFLFLHEFLGWSVPAVSRDSTDTIINYIISQDNLLLAVMIRYACLAMLNEAIRLYLSPEHTLISQNLKIWNVVYLRSLIFIVSMSGLLLDVAGGNWTQIILNSIPVEIMTHLDCLSQEILHRSRRMSVDVLQTCAQLEPEVANTQIVPQLVANLEDYMRITFLNAALALVLAIISTVMRGSLVYMMTLGLYLAIYYSGCVLELNQIKSAVRELAIHKRYSKQTIHWEILYGAFRLNSLLIVTSFFFYQESRFDLKWIFSAVSLMLIIMFVRDDVTSIMKALTGNRRINTRFRDAVLDPATVVDCTICQSRMGRPVQTRCGHMFHWHCIVLWSVYHKQQCPNCRADLD